MWVGRTIFGRTGQEVRRSFPTSAQNKNWKKNYNVIKRGVDGTLVGHLLCMMQPRVQIPVRLNICKWIFGSAWNLISAVEDMGFLQSGGRHIACFHTWTVGPQLGLMPFFIIFALTRIWTLGCIMHSRWPTNVSSTPIFIRALFITL